jgi:hypothetical protein
MMKNSVNYVTLNRRSFQENTANQLLIITVVYRDHLEYLNNFCFMGRQSPNLIINLTYICNNTENEFNKIKLQIAEIEFPKNLRVKLLLGFAPPILKYEDSEYSERIGSYRHAASLHLGLSAVNFNEYSQILIIDPDFVVLSPFGLYNISKQLAESEELDAINSVWNPAFETHHLDDICPHFFIFKSASFEKSQLDFTPKLDKLRKNLVIPKWLREKSERTETLMSKMFFNALYRLAIRGTTRETGYRIKHLMGKSKIEKMVFIGNRSFVKYDRSLQKLGIKWLIRYKSKKNKFIENGLRTSHIGSRYEKFGEFHFLKTNFGDVISIHTRSKIVNHDQYPLMEKWISNKIKRSKLCCY